MGELLKHSRTGQTEESPDPALWYRVDEQALGYLNAVLGMAPTLPVEHNEVRFVHRPDTGWTCTSRGAAVNLDDSLDLERALRDVEILKKENESLKFKKELADIDSEVLRSENGKMREKLLRLQEQSELEKRKLTLLQDEAQSLKNELYSLREQLGASKIPLTHHQVAGDGLSAVDIDARESEIPPTSRLMAEEGDFILQPAEPQQATAKAQVAREELNCLVGVASAVLSNSQQEPASKPQYQMSSDKPAQSSVRKLMILSQRDSSAPLPSPSVSRTSKVLRPGAASLVKVVSPPEQLSPAHESHGNLQDAGLSSGKPQTTQEKPTPQPEVSECIADSAILSSGHLDMQDVKPAPAHKAIVRKNYEILQKDADSPQLFQHNITLIT